MINSLKLKYITVEPSFFIFLVVVNWLEDLNSNLFLQKTCRFNQTTEPDLKTRCDDEKRGILFVSEVNLKYNFLSLLLSFVLTIFASGWSDKAGKRRLPLIYAPLWGQLFYSLCACLHSYFWQWDPITAVLSWVVLVTVSGGCCLMIVACQLYVCDISDLNNRTMRLGFIGAIRLSTLILGKGGSGFILRKFGFFYAYLLCFGLSALALILGFIFIKDTSINMDKNVPFYRMFNLKHALVDNFKVVFRKNLASKRIIVCLLMIQHTAVGFTYWGELSILYLYLRYRFQWNEQTYSDYMLYKFSTSALGIIFCSVVLSKCLKIHDGLIGTLAAIFDTIAILCLLYATEVWQLYLIPVVDLFHGTAVTIALSFMSKYYDSSELGQLSAVNGILGLIVPLSYPAYSIIFQKTLDSFPTAFCFLSAGIDIGIILCFCGSYFLSRKLDNETSRSADDSNEIPKS